MQSTHWKSNVDRTSCFKKVDTCLSDLRLISSERFLPILAEKSLNWFAISTGILPKGPYPPCLRMTDRALLARYPRDYSPGDVFIVNTCNRLYIHSLARYAQFWIRIGTLPRKASSMCYLSQPCFSCHVYRLKSKRKSQHQEELWTPIQYKMSSYQCRKSHCRNKMVVRSSYLNNGISYTGNTTSFYGIRAPITNIP